MNSKLTGSGVHYFRIMPYFLRDKYFFLWVIAEALQKYVASFRLFHCSANKPSGWTKAACRDDKHVRARFRRASTLRPRARATSSRLEPPRVPREPSADEAHRIAEIITLCSRHKIGCCGLCSRIAEIAAAVRALNTLILCTNIIPHITRSHTLTIFYIQWNITAYWLQCNRHFIIYMKFNIRFEKGTQKPRL